MKLILPWPPSMNGYWQNRVIVPKKGRAFVHTFISKAGQQFIRDVKAAVLQQLGQHEPLRGRLRLKIVWHPPDRRERDWDNPLKPLCDALAKAGVYVNDSQIHGGSAEFGEVRKGGQCEVRIAVLSTTPVIRQKAMFEGN